jgi:hypothetical protein
MHERLLAAVSSSTAIWLLTLADESLSKPNDDTLAAGSVGPRMLTLVMSSAKFSGSPPTNRGS